MRVLRSAAAGLAVIAATAVLAGCGADGGDGSSAFVNLELGPDTSSERVEFEEGSDDPQSIVVVNDSDEPQTVRTLKLSPQSAPRFKIVGGTCEIGDVLQPGESCDIEILRQQEPDGVVIDPGGTTGTETVPGGTTGTATIPGGTTGAATIPATGSTTQAPTRRSSDTP